MGEQNAAYLEKINRAAARKSRSFWVAAWAAMPRRWKIPHFWPIRTSPAFPYRPRRAMRAAGARARCMASACA